MTSPQWCHQQYDESKQTGTDGRGAQHNTASQQRVRSTQGENIHKRLAFNPCSQDWVTHQPDKREKERAALLPKGTLSCAERSGPSQHHPWRRWPLGWMDRCAAPTPQLPWKWGREAEHSSYHGILNCSPPSLTLMILESDVYMLTLKV